MYICTQIYVYMPYIIIAMYNLNCLQCLDQLVVAALVVVVDLCVVTVLS